MPAEQRARHERHQGQHDPAEHRPGQGQVMLPDNASKAIAAVAATIQITAGIRYLTAWADSPRSPACFARREPGLPWTAASPRGIHGSSPESTERLETTALVPLGIRAGG